MTCGKKHCDNAPTEVTKVDPAEVEGRSLCDHPWCGKRVVGDGTRCADGHVQGAARGGPTPEEDVALLTGVLDKLEQAAAVPGSREQNSLARPGALLARYVVAQAQGEEGTWWVAEERDATGVRRRWLVAGAADAQEAQVHAEADCKGVLARNATVVQPLSAVVQQMVPGAGRDDDALVALHLLCQDLRTQAEGEVAGPLSPELAAVQVPAPDWIAQGARERAMWARLLANVRGHMDRDPGLAAFMVRDMPQTRAAGALNLAWALTREGAHRNDVDWLLKLLEKDQRRYGPRGLAGPRSHRERVPPEPYPESLPRSGTVLLLDRDGVVMKVRQEEWGIIPANSPDEVELEPTGVAAILAAQEAGAYVAIATNQGGVNLTTEGELVSDWQPLTEAELSAVHSELLRQLERAGVDVSPGRFRIYYCPHATNAGCPCRKPRYGLPGGTAMIDEALADFGVEPEQRGDCLLIGDMASDWQAARNAGIPFALSQAGEQGAEAAHTALRLAGHLEPLLPPAQAVEWWVAAAAEDTPAAHRGQRVQLAEAGASTAVVIGAGGEGETLQVAWADEWGNVHYGDYPLSELEVIEKTRW